MLWMWLEAIGETRMEEWVICQLSFDRVVRDVEELVAIVFGVCDAMRVIGRLPDLSFELFANREGETAFDELDSFLNGIVWRKECMDMIRHDHKSMQEITRLIAVTEECSDHEVSICGALKDAVALMGYGGERVGLRVEAHRRNPYPGG